MPDEELAASDSTSSQSGAGRLVLIGLAALVLVLVAVGSALLGRVTAPGQTIVVASGPVVEVSPVATPIPVGPEPVASVGASSGPAPDRPALAATVASAEPWPAIFTPSTELPNTPGTASGYRLTRAGLDGSALAASLAEVFGPDAEVSRTEAGWVVGDLDGPGAGVIVTDDPLLTWTFTDPVASAAATSGAAIPQERAQELASALLSRVGVDIATVDWQVDRFSDRTEVTAWQVVSGARTQLSWTVGFGDQGAVVSASGFAAGIEEVPGYPIVGASTAVRRAALPTWAVLGPTPIVAASDGALANVTPTATATAASAGGPDGRPSLRVEMSDILVTEAELGLAQFRQPDGDLLILPAYVLTGDDGSRWSLIAVTGDDVRFVDLPYPTADPAAP